jgi:8-oxo-dGTP pyrophosphatase MutT (NUDIX family)
VLRIRKAFAYITHGDLLLVFRHPETPEAGIQVPAGTIEDAERPDDAVMREALEETGLGGLTLVRFLGEQVRDMTDCGRDEIHHRYFFHLHCAGRPPATWRHRERYPSDGGTVHPLFEFSWARLPAEVPALIADHGALLPALVEGMTAAGIIAGSPEVQSPQGAR